MPCGARSARAKLVRVILALQTAALVCCIRCRVHISPWYAVLERFDASCRRLDKNLHKHWCRQCKRTAGPPRTHATHGAISAVAIHSTHEWAGQGFMNMHCHARAPCAGTARMHSYMHTDGYGWGVGTEVVGRGGTFDHYGTAVYSAGSSPLCAAPATYRATSCRNRLARQ